MIAAPAPSTAYRVLQTAAMRARGGVEDWLQAERDQIILWLPVALGSGVAAWFLLPDPRSWTAAILAALAIAATAGALARGGRAATAVMVGALAVALGIALIWWRAERVAAPVLARPVVTSFTARVERLDPLPARELVRLRLGDIVWSGSPPMPAPTTVRLNIAEGDAPTALGIGARIHVRARLMPPPPAAVPGAYDFARVAWFAGLGATGRGFAPVQVVTLGQVDGGLRARLTAHVHARLPGSEGGIAAALATGDTGGIAEDDAEAMRRAGLAHLLSVSGLHITAVVGLVMLAAARLLALSPRLALTGRIPLLAAGAAAAAAVGYTWLTGNEVPTIRSCVAALMVLAAMAMGRDAVTLRLVAVGALVVLIAWPEAIAGASFQLSFAAVTAIVALHEHPRVRRWLARHDEGPVRRAGRGLVGLLVTGLLVELALMPIATFHFHQAGLYGALANVVAIPLTTFVVMPAEALALLLDVIGLGAPAWWVAAQGLALLLWIARVVAAAPGAVSALPAMPAGAFALMVAGGLWIALWRTRWRRLGIVPLLLGATWAVATPAPDLIVTGDGRHLALRDAVGRVAILRDRTGDYMRGTLAENAGLDGEPILLSDLPAARCNADLCRIEHQRDGRRWIVLATRSRHLVPARTLAVACRSADIVVSERFLPRTCRPRWLRLDRRTLARTGGVTITLGGTSIATVFGAEYPGLTTVHRPGDEHPWLNAMDSGAGYPRAYPVRAPAWGRSAADHRRDWRDRAGSSHPHVGNI